MIINPVAIDDQTFIKIEWSKFIKCLMEDKRKIFQFNHKELGRTFNIRKTTLHLHIIMLAK